MQSYIREQMYRLKPGQIIWVVNQNGWPQKCVFLGKLSDIKNGVLQTYDGHYLILNSGSVAAKVVSPFDKDNFEYYLEEDHAVQAAIEMTQEKINDLKTNLKILNKN